MRRAVLCQAVIMTDAQHETTGGEGITVLLVADPGLPTRRSQSIRDELERLLNDVYGAPVELLASRRNILATVMQCLLKMRAGPEAVQRPRRRLGHRGVRHLLQLDLGDVHVSIHPAPAGDRGGGDRADDRLADHQIIGRDPTAGTYLGIAWLSAAMGVVAGAFGSSFDRSTDLRRMTHGQRERQRMYTEHSSSE